MSEYWKSNAKKFCQICKTWYADNKVSIENHERGTKHKVMVQQRLRESAQKAQRKEREQAELNSTLRQMEQAALASMIGCKKAREEPPSAVPVGPKPMSKKERERMEFKAQKRKLEELKRTSGQSQFWDGTEIVDNAMVAANSVDSLSLEREWVQALHESGNCYYWHVCSGETRWDPPSEGFYTAAEYNEKYMVMINNTASIVSNNDAIFSKTSHAPEIVLEQPAAPSNAESGSIPSFTAMPQSSLAGTDPFATTDSRQRRAEKRKTKEHDEEVPKNSRKDLPVKINLQNEQEKPTDTSAEWELKAENSEDVIVPHEITSGKEKDAIQSQEVDERPAHPLGQWVPVIKEEKQKRVIADIPEQVIKKKPAEIVAEMEMDPSELQFQEKVLDTPNVSTKKSSKSIQFKKRSFVNKGNLRQRID